MTILNKEFYAQLLKECPVFIQICETSHDLMLMLDNERKLVYFNPAFALFASKNNLIPKFGDRPGNILRCINVTEEDDAICGETSLCRFCGAGRAILSAISGKESKDVCSIVSSNGSAFDLKVNTSQIEINGQQYVLFCMRDVSSENRKAALEKIFFHDINNIVWGIGLITETIEEAFNENDQESASVTIKMLSSAVTNLNNEIKSNLMMSLAEKDELDVNIKEVDLIKIMTETVAFFKEATLDKNINLSIQSEHECQMFNTDVNIIRRIIINMVKNAVEASSDNGEIVLGCKMRNKSVIISVKNDAVMPEDVKASIFKRAYSTKGHGRGLGTYSMRLLTERYLKGRVYFISEEGSGTTFFVDIPSPL